MNGNREKSSSIEQQLAEEQIFAGIEKLFGVKFEKNPKLFLSNNQYTYIQPDFYHAEKSIVGEIFAHIGKPKKAQDNKIANDILKMLLLENISGKKYRKIIAICDETEMKKLLGMSVLSESIRQFGIEVIYVPISEKLRNEVNNAQRRQRMTNV